MNYFKGNGSCGVTVSPNYTKEKDGITKLTLKPNASIKNDSIKKIVNESNYFSNIFTD